MSRHGLLGTAVAAAATTGLAYRGLDALPPGGAQVWRRTNAAGREVTLLGGPALAAGLLGAVASCSAPRRVRAAAVLAGGAAAVLGLVDDLHGSGDQRGLRGHLAALRAGRVTTGAAKLVGISAAAGVAGALLRVHRGAGVAGGLADAGLAAGVVAGGANLLNLLDLRPGRALKAGVLLAVPVAADLTPQRPRSARAVAAAALGAAAALLPPDLGEETMLGDAGANALGAVLGVAAAASASRGSLRRRFLAVVALTLASEAVSFSRVIDATPWLRELDRLGRRAS